MCVCMYVYTNSVLLLTFLFAMFQLFVSLLFSFYIIYLSVIEGERSLQFDVD